MSNEDGGQIQSEDKEGEGQGSRRTLDAEVVDAVVEDDAGLGDHDLEGERVGSERCAPRTLWEG